MAGHARGRLRVVRLAEVVPHLEPARRAELVLERGEELGALGLVAAALAHELVLERVEGVDVGPGEVAPSDRAC